jgi:hypothetical protein
MVPSSRGFLVRQRAAFASRGKRDTVRKTVSGSQSVILVLHWILLLPPSGLRAAFLRVSPNFNSILLSAKQNPCINLWVLLNGELYIHTYSNLKRPGQKLASAARPGVLVTDALGWNPRVTEAPKT